MKAVMLPIKSQKQLCSIKTMMTTILRTLSIDYECRLLDVLVKSFSIYIFITYPYITKEGKSVSDCITNVGNLISLLKGLHVYLYRLYWEKNLSNDQCCFRVDIWGVYTACLSCNNFFLFSFSWMKIVYGAFAWQLQFVVLGQITVF